MRRIVLLLVVLLLIAGAFIGWRYYQWIKAPNTQIGSSNLLLIRDGTTFQEIYDSLSAKGILINPGSFKWVADKMQFGDKSIKAGRYYIQEGMTNYAVIQKLRLGEQDAIDLVINSAHTPEDLAGVIGRQMAVDSFAFLQYLLDIYLPNSTYTRETILALFIPNTYEVWWNTSPQKLLERMETEHARFWNVERTTAAAALSLSPTEVYTLASIVESETQAAEERAIIAAVYLNRLRQNIALQADPTVRFALHDPSVRRILLRHLEIDSPYNTYRNTGLPPGPIAMPTLKSLDAVLHPDNNDYLFFCAKPGYEGRHLFAKTLSAHLENARRYQAWLDSEGIR